MSLSNAFADHEPVCNLRFYSDCQPGVSIKDLVTESAKQSFNDATVIPPQLDEFELDKK